MICNMIKNFLIVSFSVNPDKVTYFGPMELTEYFIQNINNAKRRVDDKGVTIEIIFKRRLLSKLLTINLSTLLINIVGQMTMYLDGEQYFEMIVATNITCLTVLASLFIFITTMVPSTSYVKMIDIWFLFNLYYPCCLIIINVFIQKSREEEEQTCNIQTYPEKPKNSIMYYKKSTVGKYIGKMLFPIVGSFFVLIYFVYGFNVYFKN